ncbi:MAG: alkaline phosphatase D family protein [Alphaproteobacteria bacterium]|nr:alkaline phosphatase D family protein [Alphaproteobacteria bacterium]MCW5740819.1 alkaline phosphatase D family protein [Alphaproteobacteria bacterium]
MLARHLLPRRRLLITGAVTVAAPAIVRAQPRLSSMPFTLGVASGSPRPDRVVLWTRLAPTPLEGGGMPDAPVDVAWELAEDERFARIAARGTFRAITAEAHSLHVEAGGLRPARPYWYRFHAAGHTSPVGRTRTAPADGARTDRLHLGLASCQQYEQGWYTAYRHMAAEPLDLVVHVGDYIYEMSWGRRHVRKHGTANPTTLAEYRDRYALYKSDADLQAAHAACPWVVTWDDHEVENDYTDDRSPMTSDRGFFLRRRAAAYRAWYEHMPVPPSMAPSGPGMRIHDSWRFGDLVDLFLLDDRQYRSHHACADGKGGRALFTDCAERIDPRRTMLGAGQEAWLRDGLSRARGRWTLIAQQTLMAEADRAAADAGERAYWMDGWDGYPAARQRLLDAMAARRNANHVVLGGDIHMYAVADIRAGNGPVVASEFVGTSISSVGPNAERVRTLEARNPHLKYLRGDKRGYVLVDLTPASCQAHFEIVDDVFDPKSGKRRLASFAVAAGKPGAVPA